MGKTLDIHYTDIRGAMINEKTLDDKKTMGRIGRNFSKTVNTALMDILDVPNEGGPYNKYERVFVDGVPASENVDKLLEGKNYTEKFYNDAGAVFVARAHMQGKKVEAIPFGAPENAKPQPVTASGTLPNLLEPKSLNFWEKFWNKWGFYQERAAEVTLHNNQVYANKKNRESLNFINKYNDNLNAISDMYFDGLDPSYYDAEKIKEGQNADKDALPGSNRNYNSRSRDNICLCMMMDRGYSMEEACEPSRKLAGVRAEVGKEFAQMINSIHSENTDVSMKAQKKLADIYVSSAKKYLNEPALAKEEYTGFLESPNPYYFVAKSMLGYDIYQEAHRGNNKTKFIMNDPKNEVMSEKLMGSAYLGNAARLPGFLRLSESELLGDSRGSMAECVKMECFNNYTIGNTNFTGKTIDEFVCNNDLNLGKNRIISMVIRNPMDLFMNTESDNLNSLEDLENGNIDMIEVVEKDPEFKSYYTNGNENWRDVGTIAVAEKKLELAEDTLEKLMTNSEDRLNQEQKNQMLKGILQNKAFIEAVHKKFPEEIQELKKEPEFLKNVVNEFSQVKAVAENKKPVEVKVKVKAHSANEASI